MMRIVRRVVALFISAAYWILQRIKQSLGFGGNRKGSACVVLYYHGVSQQDAPRFQRQMQFLARRYAVVSLADVASLHNRRAVCITFDDALENLIPHALPVLQRLSLPATIFAVSQNLGCPPKWDIERDHPEAKVKAMTPAQLQALPARLIEIGSHTCTHPHLPSLTDESLVYELKGSKEQLEALLSRPVRSFSVPYGECHPMTQKAAADAGYDIVVTCEPRLVFSGDNLLHIGRFKVEPSDWMIEFRLKAAGAYAWRRLRHRMQKNTLPAAANHKVMIAKQGSGA